MYIDGRLVSYQTYLSYLAAVTVVTTTFARRHPTLGRAESVPCHYGKMMIQIK